MSRTRETSHGRFGVRSVGSSLKPLIAVVRFVSCIADVSTRSVRFLGKPRSLWTREPFMVNTVMCAGMTQSIKRSLVVPLPFLGVLHGVSAMP